MLKGYAAGSPIVVRVDGRGAARTAWGCASRRAAVPRGLARRALPAREGGRHLRRLPDDARRLPRGRRGRSAGGDARPGRRRRGQRAAGRLARPRPGRRPAARPGALRRLDPGPRRGRAGARPTTSSSWRPRRCNRSPTSSPTCATRHARTPCAGSSSTAAAASLSRPTTPPSRGVPDALRGAPGRPQPVERRSGHADSLRLWRHDRPPPGASRSFDGVNTILFNDPNNDITEAYNCSQRRYPGQGRPLVRQHRHRQLPGARRTPASRAPTSSSTTASTASSRPARTPRRRPRSCSPTSSAIPWASATRARRARRPTPP